MTSCSYDFSNYREALSKKGLLLLLILSLAIVAMVFFHIKGMNGPWYFKWSWQRLNSPRTFVFTLIAAVPFFVGHYLHFRVLGVNSTASLTGGLIVGALAAAGIPMTLLTLKRLFENTEAAFQGASFFALSPGLIVFFPEFDQIYPIFTCSMLLFWSTAVTRHSRLYAACFGLVLSLAIFWRIQSGSRF